MAMMGTVKVVTAKAGMGDWGMILDWLCDKKVQRVYQEASENNDYKDWEEELRVQIGDRHKELSKELWALLLVKTDGEARSKVRMARKGSGLVAFVKMWE